MAGAATSISFVATKHVFFSRQKYACFVATKHVFCRDKHVFVTTEMILMATPANASSLHSGYDDHRQTETDDGMNRKAEPGQF